MKKRGHHTVIIGLHVLLIFFYFNTYCNQPPASQATDQNTATPQPAPRDSSLYFKLPFGWYEKISERVHEGRIGEYTNVNTAWNIYGDTHGFKYSLHMVYKPGSIAKRSISAYVYTPDTTIKDFSYEILPSDHLHFAVATDTNNVGIVRRGMHEFINLDR